jgi:hypothetical protein
MKKIYVFVYVLIFLPQFVIAQSYGAIMNGFNTREIKILNNRTIFDYEETIYEYYIYHNDNYSNVQINEKLENIEQGWGVRYQIYNVFGYYSSDHSLRHWTITFLGGIDAIHTHLMLDYGNCITSLYNTPEDIIEQKYLTLFVKHIIKLVDIFYSASIRRDGFDDYFDPRKYSEFFTVLLPNLKKQELAIIRNLLFARYNYSFKTVFWRNFMNMYYPTNYIGLNTEIEVMKQFNWFERFLLELIIEYEKR